MPAAEPESLLTSFRLLWLDVLIVACVPVTIFVLWRLARWWLSGRPVPQPPDRAVPSPPWPAWVGVVLFAWMVFLTVLVTLVYEALDEEGVFPWETPAIPAMFQPQVFAALALPAAVGLLTVVVLFGRRAAGAIGVRVGRPGLALGAGVLALVAVLPLCIAALLVNKGLLDAFGVPLRHHPLFLGMGEAPPGWVLALAFLQAAVLAPLAEEFMYRGVLMMSLLKKVGLMPALLITSALFALMHAHAEPQAILPLFLLAIAMGYAAYRTRSLLAPIITHALFNGVMLLAWSTAP